MTGKEYVKYAVRNIKYSVNEEDVLEFLPDYEPYRDNGMEELYDEITAKIIESIKADLPQKLIINIDKEYDEYFDDFAELEYVLGEEISNSTGWLHEGFDYERLG